MRKSSILVRIAAFLLIAWWPGSARGDKVDDLISQLRNNSDYKVRLNAALQLGRMGDKRAVPAFVGALKDSEKTVRGVAAAALGKLVDTSVDATIRKRAVAELKRVANSDPDAFVRGQAQKAYDALKGLGSGPAPAGKRVYVEVGPMADPSKQGGPAVIKAMRDTVARTIAKKDSSLQTRWPSGGSPSKAQLARAGTAAAFYVDGSLQTLAVKKMGSSAEVSCHVSLFIATFPDKSMFAFLKGGAQVQTGTTDRAIDEAKTDCVSAVLEDIVARQVVPTIQSRVP